MKTAHSSDNRLDFISAMRGLAALSVLWYHMALIPSPPLETPEWARTVIMSGGRGVTLFFVLSAFTITMSMRRRVGESKPVFDFYLRRIFRIVPLFYIWIFLSLIRDKLVYDASHSPLEILLSAVFAFNFFPGRNEGFVWASWTLGVEMVFYLLFPLIYKYVYGVIRSVGFLAVTCGISVMFSGLLAQSSVPEAQVKSFINFSFFRQLPVFAIGMLTYFIYEAYIRRHAGSFIKASIFVAAAILGQIALQGGYLKFIWEGIYWQALIFGALILGLSIVPFGIIVNRATRYMGEISYSMYLNHPTTVLLLVPVYRFIYNSSMPVTMQYGLCLAVTLAVLVPLSSVTYRFIEQPGIRFGSAIIRKRKKLDMTMKLV